MTAVELTVSGEIEVLRLRPGDRVLVTIEKRMPQAALAELRQQVERAIPDHPVIIVSPGIRVSGVGDEVKP